MSKRAGIPDQSTPNLKMTTCILEGNMIGSIAGEGNLVLEFLIVGVLYDVFGHKINQGLKLAQTL